MSLFLAVLVAVIFIVLPLSGVGLVERFLVNIAFSLMLISGAVAAHRHAVLTWIIATLAIAGLVVRWLGVCISSFHHPLLDAVLTVLLFGCLVVVLLLQVFRAGPITIHRVLGAVSAYLSIGIAWGFAYFATSLRNPDSVQFAHAPNLHEMPVGRYVYFSFVTLTTLGYGDAVPIDPVARSLAVAEALTGQLYPAVLIAGLLGLALQSRNGR
jgi:voltage-gated potassium channel Kch